MRNLFCIDIETTTMALDFRVTVLEENGGSGGNCSVAELEIRVETLEGTAADHEARISSAETDIEVKISQCFQMKKKIMRKQKVYFLICLNAIIIHL